MNIEIIGSIDGQEHFSSQQVADLLSQDQTELTYGEAFMGRPGTHLFAGKNEVVKLRAELVLNPKSARDYVNNALAQEQKLKIHHPEKTWFLLKVKKDEFKIGNICPRLNPLHLLLNATKPLLVEQSLLFLHEVYRLYFSISSKFNLRLDEGLSNFGIDINNKLYYLDDDIYTWDRFVSFSHVLGVLIRGNAWLDESAAQIFGHDLYQLIHEFFEETHTSIMVAGKLRDIYIPDDSRRKILEIIIQQLQSGKIISKKLDSKNQYLAIFADVHANLPALNAILDFLKRENINQGIVLGDTVGYGPHPAACIELLQESGLSVIKGNHDHAAVTGSTRGMSSTARWCMNWTIPRLKTEHTQWLADLPLEINNPEESDKQWKAVHGAPMDPNYFYAYVYEMTYSKNLDFMANQGMDICFHGHTHFQGVYSRNKAELDAFFEQSDQSLSLFNHSLVCPGAVGQPRNYKTGAQLAIYDQQNNKVRFLTIDYSMDKTLKDMREHDFPISLIERLEGGY
ncbi:MAG: metallophosphoesterase [Methylococcales bacterium]|nr:metallophosphoesterase [Methylococcales bacterium]